MAGGAGVALTGALLAGAAATGALGAARLRRARRVEWDGLDVALALFALLGVASGVGAVLDALGAGRAAAVAATGAGSATAAAVALVRAGRRGLGLGRPPPLATAAAPLLLGGLLPFNAAWSELWSAVAGDVVHQRVADLLLEEGPSPALLAYVVLVAPFLEEIVFRGLVVPPLARARGPLVAALGSGLLFGLVHLADPAAVVPLSVLGAVAAALRLRTGSLWPSVALHVANNAVGLVFLLPAPG